MKTKVLLIGAALGLAVATASADAVYSSNVVGYVNVDLVAGWNMIANPLDSGNNMLSTLITDAPLGTAAYKYANGGYTISIFDYDDVDEENIWSKDFSLNPGEGVFIKAPEAFAITFVGEVKAGTHSIELPAGWSLVASPTPVAGDLDEIGLTAAVGLGDAVYKYANGTYKISVYDYDEDEDMDMWSNAINVGVGEAFFVKKAEASTWTRTFEIK